VKTGQSLVKSHPNEVGVRTPGKVFAMGSRRAYLRLLILSIFVIALSGLSFAQGYWIDSAIYGGAAPRRVDVTNQVRELVRGGGSIRITNETMGVGDPAPGEVKFLRIHASDRDGRPRDFEFREKEYFDAGLFRGGPRGPEGPGPGGPGPGPVPIWGRGRRPDRGACFYRDLNFSGDYFCMDAGQSYGYLPPGFNDSITSIKIFRAQVVIYNDRDFQGVDGANRRSIGDLRNWRLPSDPRRSWNDRVSSVQVN
jgi:hypothetical protein